MCWEKPELGEASSSKGRIIKENSFPRSMKELGVWSQTVIPNISVFVLFVVVVVVFVTFNIYFYLFIYLAVPGLSCGMWGLGSLLQHVV